MDDPLARLEQAPLATASLPGTGGHIGPEPEDFRVTEIPAYAPEGEGSHCFVRLRKRGITSPEAAGRLAGALGRRPGDVGVAGLKDRQAVTEQWMSVPEVTPAAVTALEIPEVQVLEAALHPHKLRTGHLRGNRFDLRLVEVGEDAATRGGAVLAALAAGGMPNLFGPQRFGRGGENLARGLALLGGAGKVRGRRQRRLLVSAVQSALFNDYLIRRLEEGPLAEPLAGEICQKAPRGGVFRCENVAEVAARIEQGEVVVTGPLFGPKMRPPAGGRPAELEEACLAAHGVTRDTFAAWKKIAPGGRRPLVAHPEDVAVEVESSSAMRVCFTLPPGTYATVLVREITRRPFSALRS